ncbi:glycoside hydrolase family 3 N-terminal domain-containing protein [Paludibaculum fermentans]|uniref:Glycoside hydrolase family 3 C-terminal domain-containing protein n=1 Tax=Paludibaculum fermentans TaxID=1473598 RepID=A0A7S7NM26_PALFE|nr:glycoside hydrolase family 3 N-terminal domain-containing protein [Paludibaculum fermentans]QOY85619.1 glycoside hydrolase family 3 C-terminal domain-containing protein [Paludibaculum fermentans]
MKNTPKSGSVAVRSAGKTKAPAYRDPKLAPERRTKDLLGRMTLEEKAAQMICVWQQKAEKLVDAEGRFDPAKARAAFKKGHGLGQVGRPSDAGKGLDARQMAELTNAIQKFFVEESRLGIPVVFHEECLHGQAAIGGTSFPQPIGLGATFDPALAESLYTMTALEARARGAHQALTPVVDVARDPRWGRVEETFGEDPFLVSRMGIAAVRGFQGDATFRDKTRLIATLKHFAAHGQPESGMNCAPANVSERVLRETFLYPFEQAIRHGGAISIMPSYNEIDGLPSHANRWLLRDVLRKEWGFQGYAVSDYYAIWELSYRPDTHGHFLAEDRKQACKLAVEAGVNIELPEPDCYLHLVELVRKGVLKEAQLDELVAPMLLWKFRMGLFDDPYVDPEYAATVAGCEAHRGVALQAARETMTLLKNEGGLLPLDPGAVKTIAVIGPNADRPMLGGYSGKPVYCSTVLEGIRARAGKGMKVLYSEGCKITQPGSWNQDEVLPSDPAEDRTLIAAAVRTARKADVIVLAIGGNEQTSREAWSLQHMGDRTSLDLIGRQDELVRAMLALGKPVVVLLFNGRPLSIREVAETVPAVLECWYLGQETGTAVAEVLFGDVNPSGKLPITIPRSAGHVPAYYNHKPSARRGYLFDEVSPLFAFGFGLSYTTFEFSAPRLAKKSMRIDGSTRVSVDVKNTGTREGAEVVQLYIRDVVSSVTRPVKELKGFQRVVLQPGEARTVAFEITPELLAFWDVNMRFTVEPGAFELMTGNSSRDCDLQKVTLRVN